MMKRRTMTIERKRSEKFMQRWKSINGNVRRVPELIRRKERGGREAKLRQEK